jgi:hypothetical protein
MNEPVSYPATTTAKKPAPPDAGAPRPSGPRSDDSLATDVVQAACNFLRRCWKEARCLADWVMPVSPDADEGSVSRGRYPRLATGMVDRLNACRHAEWLQYLLTRKESWGQWAERTVARTYEVLPPSALADGLLRTPAALRAEDLLDLLRKYILGLQTHKSIGPQLAVVVAGAISDLLDEAGAGGEAVPEAARQLNAQLRPRLSLPNPPSPSTAEGLRACLRVLLRPKEPLWGWGCLTWDCRVRLFECLPKITEPYLDPQDFAAGEEAVDGLLAWVDNPLGTTADWLLDQLHLLDRTAARLGPILIPRQGQVTHRLWLTCLLENFRRLGQLAQLTSTEPEKPPVSEPVPTDNSAVPPGQGDEISAAPDQQPPAPPPPASPSPVPEERPPAPGVAAAETPPPIPESRGPSPDAPLATLVRAYPEQVGVLEEISRQAQEVRDICSRSGWKQAADALEGVRAKCRQHRDWLLNKTADLPPAGLDNVVKPRTVTLTDELLNNLKQLDPLLPGEGEDGPLPPHSPAHLDETQRRTLCRLVQQVRDRLFAFMGKHGGYRLYQVAIGDTTTKHSGQLKLPPPRDVVARRVPQHTVAQILQPGYVVERQGTREVKEYPSVRLAK